MPRLSPEIAAWIRGEGSLDITAHPAWASFGSATRAALLLAQGGVRVFPCEDVRRCRKNTCGDPDPDNTECKSPGKHPRIKRGVTRATTNQAQLLEWATRWPETNWGQALDTRVVVDIDVAEGKRGPASWDELLIKHYPDRNPSSLPYLPEDLRTLQYRTGRGGTQLVFERPAGVTEGDIPGLLAEHIDLKRGRASYVMVPGSITDSAYEVVHDRPPLICPPWIIAQAKKDQAQRRAAKTRAAKAAGSPSGKGLSAQLALPKDAPDKGNDWMTSVAGFLARGLHREEDLQAILRIINEGELTDPMADATLLKIARSVTDSERRNHHGSQDGGVAPETDGLHDPDHAFMVLTPDEREFQMLVSSGDDLPPLPHRYLPCGIKPRWVVDAGDSRYYHVEIKGKNHPGVKALTVPATVLADPKLRRDWLAGIGGYEVSEPSQPLHEFNGSRLMAWIEGQKPPKGKVVEFLGWHGTDFLAPDGMLRAGEWRDFDGRIPRPQVVEQSMASYGRQASYDEAVDVLRQVWTFQEPQVASVAMSWWVMALLKGTYRASIAPILYVDATSGSGKTNGFFAFLVALSGNRSGSGSITVPRVRHQLASNQSGIVWVDDMSNLRDLGEVLRQAASRGTHTKTDTTDNLRTISQHMVGNVLLSCEGVGRLLDEKAMRDRVVHLRTPSVKGRRSVLDPSRPQWDDILDLLDRFGAAAEDYAPFAEKMAGTVMDMLARHPAPSISEYRRGGDGRHAEKHAILRAGADILSELLGFDEPRQHVAAWTGGDSDKGGVNHFIGYLAGKLWIDWGRPDSQQAERFGKKMAAPVFVENDSVVYVSPQDCALAIEADRSLDARDRQLGSREAIISELQDCGVIARDCRVQRRVGSGKVSYWKLTPELSRIVLSREPRGTGVSQAELDV